MHKMANKLGALMLVMVLSVPGGVVRNAAAASGMYESGGPSAGAMIVDGLVARPLGIAATVIGVAAFVVTLPFSALGGNVEEAQRSLIEEPANFTFARPLGDVPGGWD